MKVKYFSLPNILLNEAAQPELLQDEVNPKRIVREARRFWQEPQHRAAVCERLAAATAKLGGPGAAARVAERILRAAERSSLECAQNTTGTTEKRDKESGG